jgi:fructose-specific phosphotransferase system IIC component
VSSNDLSDLFIKKVILVLKMIRIPNELSKYKKTLLYPIISIFGIVSLLFVSSTMASEMKSQAKLISLPFQLNSYYIQGILGYLYRSDNTKIEEYFIYNSMFI